MAPKVVIPAEIMLKILKSVIRYNFILTNYKTTSTAQGPSCSFDGCSDIDIIHSLIETEGSYLCWRRTRHPIPHILCQFNLTFPIFKPQIFMPHSHDWYIWQIFVLSYTHSCLLVNVIAFTP